MVFRRAAEVDNLRQVRSYSTSAAEEQPSIGAVARIGSTWDEHDVHKSLHSVFTCATVFSDSPEIRVDAVDERFAHSLAFYQSINQASMRMFRGEPALYSAGSNSFIPKSFAQHSMHSTVLSKS